MEGEWRVRAGVLQDNESDDGLLTGLVRQSELAALDVLVCPGPDGLEPVYGSGIGRRADGRMYVFVRRESIPGRVGISSDGDGGNLPCVELSCATCRTPVARDRDENQSGRLGKGVSI